MAIPQVAGHSAIRTALQTAAGRTINRLEALVDLSAHPPAAAVSLAQTAMGVAVHSEAVVGVARGASPVAASLEVPMAVDLGASTEEVAAVDSYNYSAGVGPLRKLNQINQEEDRLILFFLSLRDMKFRPVV